MTEFWKSSNKFWCEYCKVWMADNPTAKRIHEQGSKHRENMERFMRNIHKKSVQEEKDK